jgi:hypothetical protein
MATKEISNLQVELIRLTSEVMNALDNAWGNIDTIQHVLLVCDVADKQVSVIESAMQAAMGGHVSVAAFTELNYARVALKINRDANAAGLEPVVRHLSDYLQMETSFVAGQEGFSTLVHVPLIDMKSALTIWEHHILPIPLSHGLNLNLGPADYTHLAVTQDLGLYRAMTRAEFNTCRRVGEFYLCDQGLVVTKAPKLEALPPPCKEPALCLFALFARQFELARESCRTTIGGTESAMRMVSPNSFGLYNDAAHRGLVTCQGTDAGGWETKSFTASGLTKITLPHGCTAETDTHIFAAAVDGFSRSEKDYTVSYVWPLDPSMLTPGLDTKKFSDIIKRNLTGLENKTRHNIPLEAALRAVGAEYGVPLNMNDVLDKHHYVTVPIIMVIIVIILTIAVIFGVVIVCNIAKSKRQDQLMAHMGKRMDFLIEAMRNAQSRRGRRRKRENKAEKANGTTATTYQIIQPSRTTIIRGSRKRTPGLCRDTPITNRKTRILFRSTAITSSRAAGTRDINSRTLVRHEHSRPTGRSSGNARRI